MTSPYNEMIILGQNKKEKKGDGINAVLVLMKDIRDFQDKIETCIQAQTMEPTKEKVKQFDRMIDKMYKDLLEIASGGIKSIRKQRDMITPEEVEVEEEVKVQKGKPPVMVNVPQIPRM